MTPAEIAKGALRRLAQARQEPTPENYARAYAEEAGLPPPPDARGPGGWAGLIERTVRGLERGGRQWTSGRKKESLQRVLEGSGGDPARLQQRLQALLQAWDGDVPLEGEPLPAGGVADGWMDVGQALQRTVVAALPAEEPRARELADDFGQMADRLARQGPDPATVRAVQAACERAQRLLGHRHRLLDDVARLCRELGQGLTEVAEDESWARGQCELLQQRLAGGLNARSVRAATELLADTRSRHRRVREERAAASRALKELIARLLGEIGELGEQTGRFGDSVGRHAEAIAQADSLEALAGVVRTLLDESHAVQALVRQAQQRMQADHARAGELEARVRALEGELRRLSDEVSTDALTQVANRRGLQQAFEVASAQAVRGAEALAVGLIDIDNFKKLNDSLGHAAGDQALKSLAAAVQERLRPGDTVARFGGEEFVMLLPGLPAEEAQQVLTRLQRALTASLFMHDGREVFVTFSGGVTAWRPGEPMETALERADEALYEAKRTGKNRTCIA